MCRTIAFVHWYHRLIFSIIIFSSFIAIAFSLNIRLMFVHCFRLFLNSNISRCFRYSPWNGLFNSLFFNAFVPDSRVTHCNVVAIKRIFRLFFLFISHRIEFKRLDESHTEIRLEFETISIKFMLYCCLYRFYNKFSYQIDCKSDYVQNEI